MVSSICTSPESTVPSWTPSSTAPVAAVKERPHEAQAQRCRPEAVRPRRDTRGDPQRGQRSRAYALKKAASPSDGPVCLCS